ncbi:hypothetical protein [Novosphingopyxis iocasae]|uniref:hypothetical protein n=1 Tax=Novosphingopyxis iocasae TaxID=2762729 RepID=UPI001650F1A3|nr:hypothetical protein [Novosphingopyxis iocasae]|tara:strand:+ start:459 stop:902 length:444 start_codon:yes stop_codon:yes gene_type:complete
MTSKRSMVGFIDLSLILLGSVALIGELHQRELVDHPLVSRREDMERGNSVTVAIGRLFEPGEARLSVQGDSWVRNMARTAGGQRVSVRVAIDDRHGNARLDGWEQAAARTAAIMYALERGGVPSDHIDPTVPPHAGGAEGITVTISG